ncbi:dTDP-4-dehydrorhamnose reductase [Streptomyces inhibens]|uniref:dTDP-4-dehydrorhamnose reductase n=1 Tax=Streptomyces inhibens TaxID=2293571 RepID=UPI00402A6B6A
MTGETMGERWLITGAGGLLGRELAALLHQEKAEVAAPDRRALDLRDRDAMARAVDSYAPDVIVNCAAWTDADAAETAPEQALAVNGGAVRALAGICDRAKVPLIHLSTDYVFDGRATTPYPEDAEPVPLGVYGRTKLAGERAVTEILPDSGHVLRTAWLYGRHGRSFVRTMVRLASRQRDIAVVDDQRGQPTWARDVARRIVEMHRTGVPAGIYHATSAGETTWCELAREVFRLLGADPERIRPITTEERGDPAPRPAYSALGHQRWAEVGLLPPRDWRPALHQAFPEILEEEAA